MVGNIATLQAMAMAISNQYSKLISDCNRVDLVEYWQLVNYNGRKFWIRLKILQKLHGW